MSNLEAKVVRVSGQLGEAGGRVTPRLRQYLGWGLAAVVVLLLGASAADKISGSAHSLEMSASFGISPTTYRILGVVELVSALLFVIPRTATVGLLLLASYMGGAIATHLQHRQGIVFPAAIEAWVWMTAWVRFPHIFTASAAQASSAERPT